jgi:hypothetical protein
VHERLGQSCMLVTDIVLGGVMTVVLEEANCIMKEMNVGLEQKLNSIQLKSCFSP